MNTYWVGIWTDFDVEMPWIDSWVTGQNDHRQTQCFAVRAESEDDIYDLLLETLCGGSYEVDFFEETNEWKVYGDYAGPDTRFPMAKKYLKEKIDDVATVKARI